MLLRLTMQKSGRLTQKTLEILSQCGFGIDPSKDKQRYVFQELPIEVLLVRDDDIPYFVHQGACDLGIVGLNEVREYEARRRLLKDGLHDTNTAFHGPASADLKIEFHLGFSHCRLALAVPENTDYSGLQWFTDKKIATSYPASVKSFFLEKDIPVEIYPISGSVESAPAMGLVHGICDLVATGTSLLKHHLTEVETLFDSEAVMLSCPHHMVHPEKKKIFALFLQRVQSVLRAQKSKYIMMNAPSASIDKIMKLIPGLEKPTVIPLHDTGSLIATKPPHSLNATTSEQVAIHVVAREPVFWSTMDSLKKLGASAILVLPIEKMVD